MTQFDKYTWKIIVARIKIERGETNVMCHYFLYYKFVSFNRKGNHLLFNFKCELFGCSAILFCFSWPKKFVVEILIRKSFTPCILLRNDWRHWKNQILYDKSDFFGCIDEWLYLFTSDLEKWKKFVRSNRIFDVWFQTEKNCFNIINIILYVHVQCRCSAAHI